jgi:hypothetical protein
MVAPLRLGEMLHWRFLPRIAIRRQSHAPGLDGGLCGSRWRRSQRRSLFRADWQPMLNAVTWVALHCPDVTDLQLRFTWASAGAGAASSAATATVSTSLRRIDQNRLKVVRLTLKPRPLRLDAQRIVRRDSALHLNCLVVTLSPGRSVLGLGPNEPGTQSGLHVS